MKKNILKALAGVLLLSGASSCGNDWLSLSDPNHFTADQYWQTESDFESGLAAAYRYQRQSEGGFARWYHMLMILRSDEGYSTSPNNTIASYGNFLHDPYIAQNTAAYISPWRDAYTQIYYANQVLDALNSNGPSVLTDARIKEIRGQALFIRASAYWYMASLYGKTIKQTTATTSDGLGEGFMSQYEGYHFALNDLEEAVTLLPASWPAAELSRMTKGACYGLMCRINMQLAGMVKRPASIDPESASHSSEETGYWQAAKKNCEDLYALNLYSLVPEFVDNFTNSNEFNSESIWELPYMDNGKGSYDGDYHGFHLPQYAGLYMATSAGGAWDDVSAREWVLEEFDKEADKDGNTDIRKHYTLFFDDPYDPTEVLYHDMTWTQLDSINKFNKKCYWRKYSQANCKTGKTEKYSGDVNCRMIRLAEIYLNYAEIMNELGDRNTAIEYINKVRRRANMADLSAASFATRDQLLNQLKHERVMELAMESLRWCDLDRWGDLYTQAGLNEIAQRDPDFQTFTLGKSNLYPIPQREIDYYPGLTQNPNY